MARRSRTLTLAALALALVGLVATGCGDTDDDAASDATATTTTTAAPAAPTITDAWARTSPATVTDGAAYFTVTGGAADDEITGVSVDASVAASAGLHEMAMGGSSSDGMSSTTATGDAAAGMAGTTMAPTMEMRPVDSIKVPAGEKVELKPGGYHVMLMDLAKPLERGATFDLTVSFATAGDQTVTVEVKDAP